MSSKIDGTPLQIHLQKICKSFINLEDNEKRLFTQHFNKVYKHVTDSMGKVDDFFAIVFQRQQLAGSYADRIKVGQPNEYDALMILKFPDPIVEKSKPGFVKINIKEGLKKWSHIDEKKYKALIDQNGYLLQDEVLRWLRNLICNCNSVIKIEVTIRKCENGTMGKFSVDFVGSLAFDFNKQWFADLTPPIICPKNWNAIAKPNKSVPNQNQEWTCIYADMERCYLHDTQALKQLIRIFKKIRDTHNLTNLKSYYIKVIFLHQRKKQNNDYWKRQLGVLFLEMFEVILKHLEKRELISFWHNEYNLFGELTPVQATDIYNKLKKIKGNIEKNLLAKNPEFIFSAILPKAESDKLLSANEKFAAITNNGSCKLVGAISQDLKNTYREFRMVIIRRLINFLILYVQATQ